MDTAQRSPRDSWLSGVLSALATAVVLVILAAAVALAVVPRLLDGAALTVLTGSMVPTYNPGDVVVVRGVQDAATEIEIGDVVTFQPVSDDPTLITHRVVGVTTTSDGAQFITRGDANSAEDDPLVAAQIKAKVVYHVPLVGYGSLWLGQNRGLAVAAAAVGLLAYGVVMVFRRDRPDVPTPTTADAPEPTAAAVPELADAAALPAGGPR